MHASGQDAHATMSLGDAIAIWECRAKVRVETSW